MIDRFTRMGTRRMALLCLFAAMLFVCETLLLPMSSAHADAGGQVTGPNSCDYPAVGAWGLDGIANHWFCNMPTEINGSHHECVYAGVGTQLNLAASVLIFSASITTPFGVMEGACWWACPDHSMAAEPNPVQTWQGSSQATAPVVRSKCKTIAPNPLQPAPPEPGPPGESNDSPAAVIPQQQPVGGQEQGPT